MKKYKINEFARVIGVTAKTLRHYEKFHIVTPSVNDENGYRYYTFRDAERVLTSKRFSSMDFSLKRSSELINDTSISKSRSYLDKQAEILEEQARKLHLTSQRIQELSEELRLFETFPNQSILMQMPEYHFIAHVKGSEFVTDAPSLQIVRRMMDAMPFCSKMLLFDGIPQKNQIGVWGLCIEQKYCSEAGISSKPPIRVIPAGSCICIPCCISCEKETSSYALRDNNKMINLIQQELEHISPDSGRDTYVIGGIDSFSGNMREKHFLICIPICD